STRKEHRNWSHNAARILGQFGPRAKKIGPALQESLKVSLRDPRNSLHPSILGECLKHIGAADLIVPVAIASLDSKNQNERNEALYLLEDHVGATAVAPLEAAIANGQIRETQQITALLKDLRQ